MQQRSLDRVMAGESSTSEDDGSDGGESFFANLSGAPTSTLLKGATISFAMEGFMLFVAYILFSDDMHLKQQQMILTGSSTFFIMAATFVLFVVLRGCVLLCCVVQGDGDEDRSRSGLRLVIMMCLLPFAIYTALLVNVYVAECDYIQVNRTVYAQDIWLGESYGNLNTNVHAKLFHRYIVNCDARETWFVDTAVAYQLMSMVQLVLTLGIPLVFNFLVVKVSGLWAIELTDIKQRSYLQITMLNFIDSVVIIAMPLEKASFLFFRYSAIMFIKYVTFAFVVGFASCLLQVTIISRKRSVTAVAMRDLLPTGDLETGTDRWERWFAASALVFVDLPYFLIRVYLMFRARTHGSYLFLGKNAVCMIYSVAVLCAGSDENDISHGIARLFQFLPGTNDMQKQTANEYFKQLEGENRTHEEEAARLQKEAERLQDQKRALEEKVTMLDKVKVLSEAMDFHQADPAAVKDAFCKLDVNKDGSISELRLRRIFTMCTSKDNDEEVRRKGFIDEVKADGVFDTTENIDDLTERFCKFANGEPTPVE